MYIGERGGGRGGVGRPGGSELSSRRPWQPRTPTLRRTLAPPAARTRAEVYMVYFKVLKKVWELLEEASQFTDNENFNFGVGG